MMAISKKFLSEAITSLFLGLHGVFTIFPFTLFVILILLPIYLYRWILTKLVAPYFRPRIGKAVSSIIQFQAAEFDKRKENEAFKYAIVTSLLFHGDVPPDQLRLLIQEKWILARDENGDTRYPEFTQYVEYWLGFMFWKQDFQFDLSNHLTCHKLDRNGTAADSARFHDNLVEQLLNTPFPRKRSPWEIHVISNFKYVAPPCDDLEKQNCNLNEENATLMMVRLHHALADGYALTYVLVDGLAGNNMTKLYGNIHEKTAFREKGGKSSLPGNIFRSLTVVLKFIRDFGFVTHLFWNRQHPWKRSQKCSLLLPDEEQGGGPVRRQLYARSPLIPIHRLKFIKNRLGVSFTSVLLSCVGAALAKNFQEASPVINRDSLRMYMGFPAGGYKNKLRNNILGAFMSVDTTPNLSPITRLMSSDKIFQQAKTSMVPMAMYYICKLLSGSLVYPFSNFFPDCISGGISNFPGPPKTVEMQIGSHGRNVLACDAVCTSYVDVTFLLLSYNGYIRVAVTANSDALTRAEVDIIVERFCNEVQILQEIANEYQE